MIFNDPSGLFAETCINNLNNFVENSSLNLTAILSNEQGFSGLLQIVNTPSGHSYLLVGLGIGFGEYLGTDRTCGLGYNYGPNVTGFIVYSDFGTGNFTSGIGGGYLVNLWRGTTVRNPA